MSLDCIAGSGEFLVEVACFFLSFLFFFSKLTSYKWFAINHRLCSNLSRAYQEGPFNITLTVKPGQVYNHRFHLLFFKMNLLLLT